MRWSSSGAPLKQGHSSGFPLGSHRRIALIRSISSSEGTSVDGRCNVRRVGLQARGSAQCVHRKTQWMQRGTRESLQRQKTLASAVSTLSGLIQVLSAEENSPLKEIGNSTTSQTGWGLRTGRSAASNSGPGSSQETQTEPWPARSARLAAVATGSLQPHPLVATRVSLRFGQKKGLPVAAKYIQTQNFGNSLDPPTQPPLPSPDPWSIVPHSSH